MGKHLISRVIMHPDGTVHIALLDKQTLAGTPKSLSELLSNPHKYIDTQQFDSKSTTKKVNPEHYALENIKGLTLLKIYSDEEITCIFPKLFQSLFSTIHTNPEEILNLKEIISTMELSDEKHFLMQFFLNFTNEFCSDVSVQRRLGVAFEIQSEIMLETFNTMFLKVSKESKKEIPVYPSEDNEKELLPETSLFPVASDISPYLEEDLVTVQEFADIHNVQVPTVRSWLKDHKLLGVRKTGKRILIHKNAPRPADGRFGRSMPKRSESGINKYLSKQQNGENEWDAVQSYIKEYDIVSPELREFIRTKNELNYYMKNHYLEVVFNGKIALIIDIEPDRPHEISKMTNRELIKAGKSPKVHGKESFEYVIHHIGQKKNSPFAIVPGDVHVSQYNIFHSSIGKDRQKGVPNDLHDNNFEIQKRIFWNTYLTEYDKTGRFADILHRSVRRRKNGKCI